MKQAHLVPWLCLVALAGNAVAHTISGTVTREDSGVPITVGVVRIHDTTGSQLNATPISNTGTYAFDGLPPGTYHVRTHQTGMLDELWDNIPCPQGSCQVFNGTPIHIDTTPVTANFALAASGSITGSVTVEGSGLPVTTGTVRFQNADGSLVGSVFIDANGNYSHTGLAPGTYFVRTRSTGLIDELWDDIPCPLDACTITSGTPVVVPAGPVTANFELSPGGSITGSVAVDGLGLPVTTGSIQIFSATGSLLGSAALSSNGTYAFGGLVPGTYFARSAAGGYANELWDNIPCADSMCNVTTGTPINVGTGPVQVDFSLAGGRAINGVVTVAGSGQPVTTGWVRIYNADGQQAGAAAIGNNGMYFYAATEPGIYYARTSETGYFDELWNNIPCPQGICTITSGSPIAVGTLPVTVNFALETGGSIAGSVTVDGSGLAITTGQVEIHNAAGAQLGLAQIDGSGTFSYGGLGSGTYYARTHGTGFVDELWNDIPCPQGVSCNVTAGTPIGVPASGPAVVNFQLLNVDPIFSDGFD